MDEIAPEYDVVVLGTGEIPRMEGQYSCSLHVYRIDGMCAVWVKRIVPWR